MERWFGERSRRRGQLLRLAGVFICASIAASLFLGGAASGDPAAGERETTLRKAPKGLVKGAFEVKKAYLKKVRGVQCGVWPRSKKRAEWASVKILKRGKASSWAISYDQLFSSLSRKAQSLAARSKSPAIWRQINRIRKEKKKANEIRTLGLKECRRLPGADIRANLVDAVGVALSSSASPSSGSSQSRESTLLAVKEVGSSAKGSRAAGPLAVSEALDASYVASSYSSVGNYGGSPFGDVGVSDAVAGPGGVVFVRFSNPRYFIGMEPPKEKGKEVGCRLAAIVNERGSVTCIEDLVLGRNQFQNYSLHSPNSGGFQSESMQVEEDGRLYYTILENKCSGTGPDPCESTTKLKYYDPSTGERRDILGDVGAEVYIRDFEVLNDRSLIVAGYSRSSGGGTGSSWVRWFSADGDTARTLINGEAGTLTRFPDGNVYFRATVSDGSTWLSSIRRVIDDGRVAANPVGSLDPRPWIGSEPGGETPRHTNSDICVDPLATWGLVDSWAPGFCENPAAGVNQFWEMSDGRVFAQALTSWSGPLSPRYEVIKVFDPRTGATSAGGVWTRKLFPQIGLAGVHGDSLVLIGSPTSVNQSSPYPGVVGDDKVLLQDPDGVEQEVISDNLGAIDIYSLQRLSPTEMALSGQRPGSGNFVFGVVDLEAKTARVERELDVWLREVIPLP